MRISDWSSDVCSSDLPVVVRRVENLLGDRFAPGGAVRRLAVDDLADDGHDPDRAARFTGRIGGDPVVERDRLEIPRSEEHTSELQSLMRISYAVFCLKKKHTTNS